MLSLVAFRHEDEIDTKQKTLDTWYQRLWDHGTAIIIAQKYLISKCESAGLRLGRPAVDCEPDGN